MSARERVVEGQDDPDFVFGGHDLRWKIVEGPETDLGTIANGDFSGMSEPLLVACRDQKQYEAFIWEHELFCSEVRRLQGMGTVLSRFPSDKVLILLPGWWKHQSTAEIVDVWVCGLDRYTCELPDPLHHGRINGRLLFLVACLAVWGACVWYFTL